MIVIFSKAYDAATSEVMRWLERVDSQKVLRINDGETSDVRLTLTPETFEVSSANVTFSLEDISSVWYRKGAFWFKHLYNPPQIDGHPSLSTALARSMENESARAKEYFHYLIAKHCRTLGNFRMGSLNKLIVLSIARDLQLDVAEYLITNEREKALARMRRSPQISKSMSEGLYVWDFDEASYGYFTYTEEIDEESLQPRSEHLPLSFVQDKLEKRFEVRTFFLDGAFYSAAIISQQDPKTRVDYRKYNARRPNRNIPYTLPSDVSAKLTELFERLGLNTGSVDLVVGPDDKHYVLEINPSGQYDGVSTSCGFSISRRIAEWLAR